MARPALDGYRKHDQGRGRGHVARVLRQRTALALALLVTAVWAAWPQEWRDCPTCPALVAVPPGSSERADALGSPQYPIRIASPYAIGKYTVTRAEFAAFVEATGHAVRGCTLWRSFGSVADAQANWRTPGEGHGANVPAVCVSWDDAQTYVHWLAQQTGQPYRLPSEAEWEYAARAGLGLDGTYWLKAGLKPGGANCADCGGMGMMGREDLLSIKAVGTYDPNAFGLYDMMGNVAQWVADCANPSIAEAPQDGSAWLAGDCTQHVTRGGTWHSDWSELASYRKAMRADERRDDTGFRVAKTLR